MLFAFAVEFELRHPSPMGNISGLSTSGVTRAKTLKYSSPQIIYPTDHLPPGACLLAIRIAGNPTGLQSAEVHLTYQLENSAVACVHTTPSGQQLASTDLLTTHSQSPAVFAPSASPGLRKTTQQRQQEAM